MLDITGLRHYLEDQALVNNWVVDYTYKDDNVIITIQEQKLELIPANELENHIARFINRCVGRDNRDDLEDTDFWKYLQELVRRAERNQHD